MGLERSQEDLDHSRKMFEDALGKETSEELQFKLGQVAHFYERWLPGKITIGNEQFDLYDMHPEISEQETPILFVPGFVATPEIFKENIRSCVAAGYRTLSVEAPHGSEHSIAPEDRIGKVTDAELRRIAAFMSGLDAAQIEKADAIGHSEGAIDVLLAAALFPERFNNIVLVNPGGLIADDDPIRLSLRFIRDAARSWYFAWKQGTLEEKMLIDKLSMPNVFSNVPQSTKEVISVARTATYQLLRQVRESGIGITIIHGPQDAVFPIAKIRTTIQDMKENPQEDILKLVNGFYSVAGDHNTFIRRAPEYTRLAVGALKAMKKNGEVHSSKTDATR